VGGKDDTNKKRAGMELFLGIDGEKGRQDRQSCVDGEIGDKDSGEGGFALEELQAASPPMMS